MSEFLRSNPKLDALVNASTNFEAMREQMKTSLANDGVIARERSEYGATLLRQPETDAPEPRAPQTQEQATHFRKIYPSGNDEYTIYGYSQNDLDLKEAAIRQALGQR